jgi:hypothetical protein
MRQEQYDVNEQRATFTAVTFRTSVGNNRLKSRSHNQFGITSCFLQTPILGYYPETGFSHTLLVINKLPCK